MIAAFIRYRPLKLARYTVTTTGQGFKKSVVNGVKVDVATPATVNVALQTGDVAETVTVSGGAEVVQAETATIGSTISGRQITETPIPSRDAVDLISLLPGTASVGRPRAASINGLPKGAINIDIDGVDVQDNLLRSSDGYFTYVRPRVDNLEEVTVNNSNPGADASGDGAVQISFVTKRGTNHYNGTAYWQHRNDALNSNYRYANRDKNLGVDSRRSCPAAENRALINLAQTSAGPSHFRHLVLVRTNGLTQGRIGPSSLLVMNNSGCRRPRERPGRY